MEVACDVTCWLTISGIAEPFELLIVGNLYGDAGGTVSANN